MVFDFRHITIIPRKGVTQRVASFFCAKRGQQSLPLSLSPLFLEWGKFERGGPFSLVRKRSSPFKVF